MFAIKSLALRCCEDVVAIVHECQDLVPRYGSAPPLIPSQKLVAYAVPNCSNHYLHDQARHGQMNLLVSSKER